MVPVILVGLGGAVGSILRYWLSNGVYYYLGRDFPYGTLVVNCLGSIAMGLIAMVLTQRWYALGMELRSLLMVGLLGGFTTFSSFALETFSLIEMGHWARALINIFASVSLCLIGLWLGTLAGKNL